MYFTPAGFLSTSNMRHLFSACTVIFQLVGMVRRHTKEVWSGAPCLPWDSSVNLCGGCRCSHATVVWPLGFSVRTRKVFGPLDGSNTLLLGTASEVVKARTIKRLPPGERWTGSLLDEAQGSELTPNALKDDGSRIGIRAPVLQPHVAVPLPPLVQHFDKCDGRHCAERILSSLVTQIIAQDVPTPELVENKRLITQNRVAPAWKHSWTRPLKDT